MTKRYRFIPSTWHRSSVVLIGANKTQNSISSYKKLAHDCWNDHHHGADDDADDDDDVVPSAVPFEWWFPAGTATADDEAAHGTGGAADSAAALTPASARDV